MTDSQHPVTRSLEQRFHEALGKAFAINGGALDNQQTAIVRKIGQHFVEDLNWNAPHVLRQFCAYLEEINAPDFEAELIRDANEAEDDADAEALQQ